MVDLWTLPSWAHRLSINHMRVLPFSANHTAPDGLVNRQVVQLDKLSCKVACMAHDAHCMPSAAPLKLGCYFVD